MVIPRNKKHENFAEWFEQVTLHTMVYDYRFPVKGCGVWPGYGFKLRKNVLDIMRNLLDSTGHEECLFPLLIPRSLLEKETEHIRSFEGEVFWVTRGGLSELGEKLALRPTSETAVMPMLKLWIKDYKDLPVKLYQIVSVFRYETKATHPMIRVREVTTFKEGHSAHATYEDAEKHVWSMVELYKKFFNELVVLKESRKGVYLLEGYSPTTYGSLCLAHTVGCSSPNTAVSAEVGFPNMHRNEAVSVIVWMESDGIYVIDGRKPKKVSLAVDHYFNTEYATAISASYLDKCSAFADPLRNEYHLLVPDGTELVYNYLTDEWYPPWEREMTLRSGCVLQGTDGRPYVYGGSSDGFVLRLENDTTDKDSSNSDVAIEHSLKTRAISADPKQATTLEFLFRRVWIEAKARSSGEITTKLYKDLASSGETLAKPSTMSLVNSGYSLATPSVGATKPNCKCFQLEFSLNSADIELEIWSFLYQISLEGVIE